MDKGTEAWRAQAWIKTGRDVADLRDHWEEIGDTGSDDSKPLPGRLYNPGYMEKVGDGWMVNVGNHSALFAVLADAEKMLWDEYASAEVEHRQ